VDKPLFGEGGVQGLDGSAYHDRKMMFMKLMDDDAMDEIGRLMKKYWREYFEEADSLETVELYEAAKIVTLKTACAWTGVPLGKDETEVREEKIADMFESRAQLGIQEWKGRRSVKQ